MTSTLPERPILKRHLLATTVHDTDVFVLSEDDAWIWTHKSLGDLLAVLDGRDLAEVLGSLAPQLSPPRVIYLLRRLHERGLLTDGSVRVGNDPQSTLPYWSAIGPGDAGAERLSRASIRVRPVTPTHDTEALAEALDAVAVERTSEVPNGLDVVVTDHYLQPELIQFNEEALSSSRPWMLCALTGRAAWIGPVMRPGHTACLQCLRKRLRCNQAVPDFLARRTGDTGHFRQSLASHPATTRIGAAWAAHEIAAWVGGRTDRLDGSLLSVALGPSGPEIENHTVVRDPRCPACGTPVHPDRHPDPVVLHSLALRGTDGRTERPEEALARLRHHISPVSGIITDLRATSADPDGLVHTYSAQHYLPLGPDTVGWLRADHRSRTCGKGASDGEARISAVGEAIERHCGVFCDDVPRIRASYQDLGGQAVHPEALLQFSDDQYARRDELNRRAGAVHLIPRRLPAELEIEWAPLWSLTSQRTRYLPAAFCYFGHPDIGGPFYCTGEPNGCAAGATIEEAVFAAFMELVERDSAALWWYNRAPRPAIDLASGDDPFVLRVRDWHARDGRDLWALDLTADLGIPVIACVSRRVDAPFEDLLIGFGAHVDPGTALRHAVVEVNQFLPAVSRHTSTGQTMYSWPDHQGVRFWTEESLDTQPQLIPAPELPLRRLTDFPDQSRGDMLDVLEACVDVAQRQGMEVLVLDQSRPDVELRVARVVVPGLRHFWPRLGPGRLYEVPVRLGWIPAAKAEAELNPTSIFF